MTLPGGIRTTLAVALLLIVGGALGGAYLMVVPSLERRLVDERLDELQRERELHGVLLCAARLQQPVGDRRLRERWSSPRTGVWWSSRSSARRPRCGRSRTPRRHPARSVRTRSHSRLRGPRGSPGAVSTGAVASSERWRSRCFPGTCSWSRPRSRTSSPPSASSSGGCSTQPGSRSRSRRSSAAPRRPSTRGGSAVSSAPRTASQKGSSMSPWSTSATTSSASWRPPSSGCASSSRSSTPHARSSSRTRPTSYARRSSRLPASSS